MMMASFWAKCSVDYGISFVLGPFWLEDRACGCSQEAVGHRSVNNFCCRLMLMAGVKRSRQQQRGLEDVERLEEFVASCRDIAFSPPLGPKEAKFLESLQSERLF